MRPAYNAREFIREFGGHCPDTQRYLIDPPPEDEIAVWHAWLQQHGIPPDPVKLTRWIERRTTPGHYQIVWLEDNHDGSVHVERHIDLAEPPAPFPTP